MTGILGIERPFYDGSDPSGDPLYVFSLAGQPIIAGQKNYFGVSAAPADTEAFIKSLAGSIVSTSNVTAFTISAGGGAKVYFAAPTRYGFAAFAYGGFTGGFILRSSAIALTNAQGLTENFSLYESVSAGLGTVTVEVS